MTTGRLQDLDLQLTYGPADLPRDRFYVPSLAVANRYDRLAGYFRSSSLQAIVDDGVMPFVSNGGKIRVVVHAEMTEEDVRAVIDGQDLRAKVGEATARQQFEDGSIHLTLFGQLIAIGALDIQVAVSIDPDTGEPTPPDHPRRAIFHAKTGVIGDRFGDRVAFKGSTNESPSGWTRNYEDISVFRSWDYAIWDSYGTDTETRFDRIWNGRPDDGWQVLDLPDADRKRLIEYAERHSAEDIDWTNPGVLDGEPAADETLAVAIPEPPATEDEHAPPVDTSLADALREILGEPWAGIRTAPVTPWPHQDATGRAGYRAVTAALRGESDAPKGRVFSDEVGLGKTIEVALTVREALVAGTARRVLVLAPASVAPQWQGELWEKASLWVPRLARSGKVVWPDKTETTSERPWKDHDVLLASSHLARLPAHRQRVLDAGWDIVVVDEAHHARRREAKKPGTANNLLRFLRQASDHPSVGSILLATATPMQMHVHEARDLLDVLGLPDEWDDTSFTWFYDQLDKAPDDRNWQQLAALAHASVQRYGQDTDVNATLAEQFGPATAHQIQNWHQSAEPWKARQWSDTDQTALTEWLRSNAPLRNLVLRSTRDLLRAYRDVGLIGQDVTIPKRDVDDIPVHMPPDEQELYDRIEVWIRDHYQAATAAKQTAAGFVMTVYRRRLTSSLAAIRVSLGKRLVALQERRTLTLADLVDDEDLDIAEDEVEDELEDDDSADATAAVDDEIAHVTDFLDELDRVLAANGGKDAKFGALENLIRTEVASGQHRTAIVFTQYTDTMLWLRDHLAGMLGRDAVACYFGGGGLMWDAGSHDWRPASKEKVTKAFRSAATDHANPLRILLGTDSMSEGLNLQTCDLLVNYDLPWNFMRLEQRIGRVDRIGGQPNVHIRNLVIEGTVEERVRSGIGANHSSFVNVVGSTGKVIEDAITACGLTAVDIDHQIDAIRAAIQETKQRSFTLADFNTSGLLGDPERDGVWEFDRGTILDDLKALLTTHEESASRFEPSGTDGILVYPDGGRRWHVTFDPVLAEDRDDVALFVPGHPAFPV